MPAFSGIELAKEIRSFDKSAAILFFSSSPEYALDSYSVQSLNYVLKPVSKEKLFSVFDNLLDQINARNKEDTIIVKSHHGIQKILISNLVFVEVMGRTVLYHLLSGKVIQCSESFSAVCDNLLKFGCFIKPHRSYLVNMQYVDTITNHQMTLQTLNIIPVAQGKAREIKQQYLNYQLEGDISYLCCQAPRWFGSLAGHIFDSVSMNHITFIVTALGLYLLLQAYAFCSIRHLMERSVKSCLLFASMPVFYYFFDYITTVYTDFMYKGSQVAIQFLPFVTSAFYFIFVLLYYAETQKQTRIQKELDMIESQFKQAQKEFSSIKQIQENASEYRHDMRHHFSLLQSLASKGDLEAIKNYLQTVQSDLDKITPLRFCKNETINLILSAFTSKAEKAQIQLNFDVKLTEKLNLTDTELCSLLSNALENAITACEKIENPSRRIIKLRLFSKNKKLCIDIRNSYQTKPFFHQNLPVSKEKGHGFGTKSMAHIIEKHDGIWQFSVKDGLFVFQATL